MKIDMSAEAITNRLRTMEQLWELSINLMAAREISETVGLSKKSLDKDWDSTEENEFWKQADGLSTV